MLGVGLGGGRGTGPFAGLLFGSWSIRNGVDWLGGQGDRARGGCRQHQCDEAQPLTEASGHVGCAQWKKAHTAFPGQSPSLRGAEVQQSEWALTRTRPRPRMAPADGRIVGIG